MSRLVVGGAVQVECDEAVVERVRLGGKENGRLVCTYDDFATYGIRRRSLAAGIAELVALGFIEVTERGRMAAADFVNGSTELMPPASVSARGAP